MHLSDVIKLYTTFFLLFLRNVYCWYIPTVHPYSASQTVCLCHYRASCFAPASVCGLLRTWWRSTFTSPTESTATRWWTTKISPRLTSSRWKWWKSSTRWEVCCWWRESLEAGRGAAPRAHANQSKTVSAQPAIGPANWGKNEHFFVVLFSFCCPPTPQIMRFMSEWSTRKWRREIVHCCSALKKHLIITHTDIPLAPWSPLTALTRSTA